MKNILVVGSMNMDLIVKAQEIPKLGETVIGESLNQIPGGKGANQAISMAKLGKKVTFLGKVGNDTFGNTLLDSLLDSGVDGSRIERGKTSTGIAIINLDKDGNNNIVVVPGTNWEVESDYLLNNQDAFEDADIVVFQLEIPLESVVKGLEISKKFGKTTILNPAPARDLDNKILEMVDVLIPNEHELERLSGLNIKNDEDLVKGAQLLLDKGVKKVIVTLGSNGVLYADKQQHKFIDAYKVDVIDTTAAGDSFIGGFTASLEESASIEDAIEIGQKTAALTIQKIGAQSSLPSLEDLEDFSQRTK